MATAANWSWRCDWLQWTGICRYEASTHVGCAWIEGVWLIAKARTSRTMSGTRRVYFGSNQNPPHEHLLDSVKHTFSTVARPRSSSVQLLHAAVHCRLSTSISHCCDRVWSLAPVSQQTTGITGATAIAAICLSSAKGRPRENPSIARCQCVPISPPSPTPCLPNALQGPFCCTQSWHPRGRRTTMCNFNLPRPPEGDTPLQRTQQAPNMPDLTMLLSPWLPALASSSTGSPAAARPPPKNHPACLWREIPHSGVRTVTLPPDGQLKCGSAIWKVAGRKTTNPVSNNDNRILCLIFGARACSYTLKPSVQHLLKRCCAIAPPQRRSDLFWLAPGRSRAGISWSGKRRVASAKTSHVSCAVLCMKVTQATLDVASLQSIPVVKPRFHGRTSVEQHRHYRWDG